MVTVTDFRGTQTSTHCGVLVQRPAPSCPTRAVLESRETHLILPRSLLHFLLVHIDDYHLVTTLAILSCEGSWRDV